MNLTKRPDCMLCGAKETAVVVMYGKCFCGHCTMNYIKAKQAKEQEEMARWMADARAKLPEM